MGLLETWTAFCVLKSLINSLDSTIHIVSQKEERGIWFLKLLSQNVICAVIFKACDLKYVYISFFSHSDDPIVTSLVKHKEFDELVHWHSRKPLSDDYDRTKGAFDGELCDTGEIN